MNLILAITTYNRPEYLRQLLDSFFEFTDVSENNWTIIIHSDSKFPLVIYPFKCKYKIIYSDRIGVHAGTNKLLKYASTIQFDYAFKVDDDIYFTRKGWEQQYINTSFRTGYMHLCYKNSNWNNHNSGPGVFRAMGCLWTFTPQVLKDVGYFDVENFGFRGIGHLDYSARCCRAGYNNSNNFLDARNSNDFIGIHSGPGYIGSLPASEVMEHRRNQSHKMQIAMDESRIYVPLK